MNIKIKASEMSCLLGGDYDRMYKSLRKQLSAECAELFTERVPGNDYLQWELPGDGWVALSECEQVLAAEVRRQLSLRQDAVRARFGANQVLADQVLTVPNDTYVYYRLDSNGGIHIALTAWGYIPKYSPSEIIPTTYT